MSVHCRQLRQTVPYPLQPLQCIIDEIFISWIALRPVNLRPLFVSIEHGLSPDGFTSITESICHTDPFIIDVRKVSGGEFLEDQRSKGRVVCRLQEDHILIEVLLSTPSGSPSCTNMKIAD